MSISVKNVTKQYGNQKALNNVSFDIGEKEIVGFLGPNGAGKSTMMKIISCYLPQSEGDVLVCGKSVTEQSLEVRKLVGYLPEQNPLYTDMYVREYLTFTGKMHGIANVNARVDELIEMVGLTLERKKKIAALSKGYKQRVGLAQALIHDPKVLILDEPTTGLDPNQIVEVRNLIKQLGQEKTVMLSTHIMQEVSAICDRIIIINHGELKADDSTEQVMGANLSTKVLTVEFADKVKQAELEGIEGVVTAKHVRNNLWAVEHAADVDVRKAIFNFAVSKDNAMLTVQPQEKSLEEIFRSLTQG